MQQVVLRSLIGDVAAHRRPQSHCPSCARLATTFAGWLARVARLQAASPEGAGHARQFPQQLVVQPAVRPAATRVLIHPDDLAGVVVLEAGRE